MKKIFRMILKENYATTKSAAFLTIAGAEKFREWLRKNDFEQYTNYFTFEIFEIFVGETDQSGELTFRNLKTLGLKKIDKIINKNRCQHLPQHYIEKYCQEEKRP